MTFVWVGVVAVVVGALVLALWPKGYVVEHADEPYDTYEGEDVPLPDVAPVPAMSPVPIERALRKSKPRASEATVLTVLDMRGPSTAREVAGYLRDTTPTIVAGILVKLRNDSKVTSATKRNLQVWDVKR